MPYKSSLLSHVTDELEGFVRVAWNKERRVVGGLAAGRDAAGVLAVIAVVIKLNGTIEDLVDMQGPHPTLSELPYIAARMKS